MATRQTSTNHNPYSPRMPVRKDQVRDGCIWGVDMLQESNWTATKGHYVHTVPGRDTPYTVRHASPSTFGSGANPGAAFPLSRNS
ncbi:hypothetical protein VFPFJ_00969 [Purpureocillium lilacinum]|uniref:Uncharacterized protein n=1 Tax=Purpureocillium lilacinum TaxID=33203 RepID=A0A179HZU9_PURLI|nr:hypothetical protein VFPFJ_00969 [Purpureocillium lilacinum]OAQ86895.1 hypothetical protein VFPBJ_00935 [Purpureocillium lilacinum]OAQ94860.1 hypothetical protein VFPFJ_00969 [Purpureocillium lilacinum]